MARTQVPNTLANLTRLDGTWVRCLACTDAYWGAFRDDAWLDARVSKHYAAKHSDAAPKAPKAKAAKATVAEAAAAPPAPARTADESATPRAFAYLASTLGKLATDSGAFGQRHGDDRFVVISQALDAIAAACARDAMGAQAQGVTPAPAKAPEAPKAAVTKASQNPSRSADSLAKARAAKAAKSQAAKAAANKSALVSAKAAAVAAAPAKAAEQARAAKGAAAIAEARAANAARETALDAELAGLETALNPRDQFAQGPRDFAEEGGDIVRKATRNAIERARKAIGRAA